MAISSECPVNLNLITQQDPKTNVKQIAPQLSRTSSSRGIYSTSDYGSGYGSGYDSGYGRLRYGGAIAAQPTAAPQQQPKINSYLSQYTKNKNFDNKSIYPGSSKVSQWSSGIFTFVIPKKDGLNFKGVFQKLEGENKSSIPSALTSRGSLFKIGGGTIDIDMGSYTFKSTEPMTFEKYTSNNRIAITDLIPQPQQPQQLYRSSQSQSTKQFEITTNETYYRAMVMRMKLVDYITENIFNNLQGQIDYSNLNTLFDILEIKDPIIGMPFLSMISSNPDLNNTFIKIYDSSVNLSHPFIKGGKTKTVDLNEYLGLIKFGLDNPLNMTTVENQYQYNYTNPYGTIELDRMGFFEVPKGRLFSSALQDNYVPNSPYYKSLLALTMFGLYSIPTGFKLGNADLPNGIKYMNNLYNNETTGLIVSYNNGKIDNIIGTTSHKIIKKIAQPLGLSNARNEIFNHIFGRTAYYSDNVGENLDKDIAPASIQKENNYMVTNMIDRKTGQVKSILKMKRLDLTNTTFKYNSSDEIDKFISANLCNGILVEENNKLLNRPAIFRNNIITESECSLLGRYKMKDPKGNNKSADWQQVFLPTLFTSVEMESIAEQIIMHSIKNNESKVSPLVRLALIKQLANLLFNIQQAIFETPYPLL